MFVAKPLRLLVAALLATTMVIAAPAPVSAVTGSKGPATILDNGELVFTSDSPSGFTIPAEGGAVDWRHWRRRGRQALRCAGRQAAVRAQEGR